MLRSNTKIVQERMTAHVKKYYPDAKVLKRDIELQHDDRADFYRACKLVEAGCFLCYFNEVRNFLQDTQEMTKEQINRYSDKQLWLKYQEMVSNAAIGIIYRELPNGK